MNLSLRFTGQVQLLSRLTYILLSYCPLLNISFPNFSSLSYKANFFLLNVLREILRKIWVEGDK